jgi:hypothetical protein
MDETNQIEERARLKKRAAEAEKRIEHTAAEIRRLTEKQSRAIEKRDGLEADEQKFKKRMNDGGLSESDQEAAEGEFRRTAAALEVENKVIGTFNEPLAKLSNELAAAEHEKRKAERLLEIAEIAYICEELAKSAETQWDQRIREAGTFVPDLMRGVQETGRRLGARDPLAIFGGAQNIFAKTCLYSNLQSVEEPDLGGRPIPILDFPGAKSYRQERGDDGPITMADHLRQAFEKWVADAKRRSEMSPEDRAMLQELNAEFARQGR